MTELEKITYARSFIEKLANGVNPLNDQPVPDDDLVNHVRMSRCFFFVSDVLRQVIENGGVQPAKRVRRKAPGQPFHLSEIEREGFVCTESPVTASVIIGRLNELSTTPDMRKLTYRNLTDWLTSGGYLTPHTSLEGKQTLRPTPKGHALGITLEDRHGSRGAYKVVLYNADAQRFIVEHLDDITALCAPPQNLPARPQELRIRSSDDWLSEQYRSGVSVDEIAAGLRQSSLSIQARLRTLGLLNDSPESSEPS